MFGARVRKRAGARSCCIPAELLAIKGLKEVVFSRLVLSLKRGLNQQVVETKNNNKQQQQQQQQHTLKIEDFLLKCSVDFILI